MSLKTHLTDFSGVALASVLATALDGLVFAGLMLWEPSAEHPGVSAAVAAIFGGVFHYTICRFFVFRRFEATFSQSATRYVAMSGSAALIHGAIVSLMSRFFALSLVWLVSKILVYALWTYPLSRYFVFDVKTSEGA
jgi:putative flippase GtrA